MSESATVSFARPITAAAGVYAPGHIGELTQYLPFELVDDVLSETRTVQRRLRVLPSRVGVYFVLALVLFPRLGYARVWQKLTAGLIGLDLPSPSEKALRDLRRRLGPAPFKALFEVVAGPLGQPRTPGVCYRGMRTVAFDGCNSLKVPDTERNRCWLGRIRYRMGFAGYPTLRLMTLIETGTRGHARRRPRLGGRPRRGHPGPAPAAAAAPEACWCCSTGPSTPPHSSTRSTSTGAQVPGAQQVHPPTTGADPSARRLLPVRPRRAARAHHRRGTDRHRRRRQPGLRPLPADHHPAGPRPPSGGRAGQALPRTLGDRDRLPGAAAHHPRRTRAALPGPARARAGDLGPAHPLPAAPDGHGHRGRDTTRHQPRPGQLHHRPAGRPRPAHRRRRDPPTDGPHRPPTCSVSSVGPSWPPCCHPADPAGAPARSRTPPPATSTATTAGRTCPPPSPASTSPCTPQRRREMATPLPQAAQPERGPDPPRDSSPRSWKTTRADPGAAANSPTSSASNPTTCSPNSPNGLASASSPAPTPAPTDSRHAATPPVLDHRLCRQTSRHCTPKGLGLDAGEDGARWAVGTAGHAPIARS